MLCNVIKFNLAEYTSVYRKNNHIKGKHFFKYAIQKFIVLHCTIEKVNITFRIPEKALMEICVGTLCNRNRFFFYQKRLLFNIFIDVI